MTDVASAAPTILVVDDEVMIRMLASELLQDAGFRVIEAADADEAVTILESNITCDVVFTDINMPGSIDGFGLVAYVKESHPSLPVVVTSGGVPLHLLSRGEPAAVVAKPYSEADLTLAISKALETRYG